MTFNRSLFSSASDKWNTPRQLFLELNKEFDFDHDPCPEEYSEDGLKTEWGKSNFVNPPYSGIKDWIKKGFWEWQKGKTVVFLIPSRTDTKWWHEYVMKATEIRFIKGRLKFGDSKNSAPFPSAIIVFNKNEVTTPLSSHD